MGADAGEDTRLVGAEVMQALRETGLLAALAPREVGGFQVGPLTEMELIEAVSAVDGSTGWLYWALAGSTARAASMLPAAAVGAVFPPGGPFPLIAFQERAFGNTVVPTRAGLRVDGRWPFGTGAAYADWVLAIGRCASPVYCPWPQAQQLAAVVPASQFEVVDCWDGAGLAATGTVDYRVADVVIPWSRVWPYPVEAPVRGGAHFSFRRAAIKHLGFALGVAKGSIEEFTAHAGHRYGGASRRVPDGLVAQVARSRLAVDAARSLGVEAVTRVWREASDTGAVAESSYRRLRAVARYASEVAFEVCALVARYGDARLVGRQHRAQRALRDIVAGCAHAEMSSLALDEFGRDLLGVEVLGR
ncbi:acyl-CoA dehydrogenase family protein [Nocardia nepalensis]|uniref:acyl-CoA dehydrogenase family protein n=1 Tax=Nocardia nepalensis TaxID=3375448 RepID=UPI003B685D07